MTTKTPFVFGALLVFAGFGCSRDGRAHAVADPDSAHAEAHVDTRAYKHAYDESKVARTGVTLDDEITKVCKVQPTESFFAFDSTSIDAGNGEVLERVADCLRDGALVGRHLELIGHTDPRGSDEYNKQLGISRAEAVAGFLRDYGVPTEQIEVTSHGESESSPSVTDWPLDRRVDIRIKSAVAAR